MNGDHSLREERLAGVLALVPLDRFATCRELAESDGGLVSTFRTNFLPALHRRGLLDTRLDPHPLYGRVRVYRRRLP